MSTNCPFCGTDTGIDREIVPGLDPLSLEEFDTLVRREWRRHLRTRKRRAQMAGSSHSHRRAPTALR